jgi:tyrosyl-tRNA synthetase
VYSFKAREEIEALERESAERPAGRAAQRALAEELTTLVHGAEEARRAIAASQALFGQGELSAVDERTLQAAKAEVPSMDVIVTGEPGNAGVAAPAGASEGACLPSIADLMVGTKIVASKSAARRAIAEGGAYLNNRKVTDVDGAPTADDLLHGRFLILRRGKRTVGAVEVIPSGGRSARLVPRRGSGKVDR